MVKKNAIAKSLSEKPSLAEKDHPEIRMQRHSVTCLRFIIQGSKIYIPLAIQENTAVAKKIPTSVNDNTCCAYKRYRS